MRPPSISSDRLRSCSRGLLLGMACGELTVSGSQLATEMALELGEAWLENPATAPEELGRRWLALLPRFRDRPRSLTRAALELRQLGFTASEAAEAAARRFPGRDGDGPLTSCLPLATLCYLELANLKAWTGLSASVTHSARATQVAAVASCLLARDLMLRELDDALTRAAQAIREESPARVVAALHRPDPGEPGPSGDDASSVLAAAVLALSQADSIEGVLDALSGRWLSGDGSGALAGALAGAHWGEDAIPRPLLTALPDQLRRRLEWLGSALAAAAVPLSSGQPL